MTQRATDAQIRAADPASSSWVSANAGSGKTRVLTNRVARLLLEGTRPERILCLTFTRAAAAEMQGRLFGTLGKWAMLPDEDLRKELAGIGAAPPADLSRARTLFAGALETPGGLKIQTIHSFCTQVLRRFPLEAGVPPGFREIDDRQAALLRIDILDAIARQDGDLLTGMAHFLSNESSLDALLKDILKQRRHVESFDPAALKAALGVGDQTRAEADAQAIARLDLGAILKIGRLFAAKGGRKDLNQGGSLVPLSGKEPDSDLMAAIRSAVTGKDGSPYRTDSYPTKALGDDQAWIREVIEASQAVVADWMEETRAIAVRDRTLALMPFARAFLGRYAAAKSDAGLVDFDDQIALAARLLTRSDVAAWVLYKLDSGIEHILVDEAQDTSPDQWQIVAAVEAEFSAGRGAVERARTLFVVGDKKQSIFSFQGADPAEFDRRRDFFSERLAAVGRPFADSELTTSFRSAAPILELVDRVFDGDPDGALGGPPAHVALPGKPGRIDVWPFETTENQPAEPGLAVIEDRLARANPVLRLARDLAGWIAETVGTAALPGKLGPRPVTAGDILVLVRKRSPFFHQLIDSLKAAGVPVAGADRLRIGEEIAVKDLLSTLRFLAAPFDDLSLAEALRSPLFGLSEADLFAIAHGRGAKSLWQSLLASGRHAETVARLTELRKKADFERPYEILEHVLLAQGGRRRLTERLGAECEDAVDELLAASLEFERARSPSIGGFVSWMAGTEIEIKRDMEAARDQVRVMTVHGAKGLEAPIVILPDVGQPDSGGASELVLADGIPIWNVSRKLQRPRLLSQIEAAHRTDQAREYARLLYVALTRAEHWLVVCGAGKPAADRWHARVAEAFAEMGPATASIASRDILTLTGPGWPGATTAATGPVPPPPLPDWVEAAPAPPPKTPAILQPSDLAQPHALAGELAGDYGEEAAMQRGTAIHALLDTLHLVPTETRAAAARHLVDETEHHLAGVVAEVTALLDRADLAPYLGPDALAEVPFTAETAAGRISGRIDRLVVAADRVTALDFKSNRIVPGDAAEVPEGILAQMGAYAVALGKIFPGRRIETRILWTRTGTLMTMPHDAVTAAFDRAAAP